MIDFTANEGNRNGEVHLGIYELGKKTRKLCFAPPRKERPTDLSQHGQCFNGFACSIRSCQVLLSIQREELEPQVGR